jgi:hypothetical protein
MKESKKKKCDEKYKDYDMVLGYEDIEEIFQKHNLETVWNRPEGKSSTITLNRDHADFESWQEGLADLDLVGIHTVIFQTNNAKTELQVTELLAKCAAGDNLTLSHRGTDTKLLKTQEITLN